MNTYSKYLSFFLLLAFVLSPGLASAADFRAGDQVSISQGDTLNDDLYAGGGTVTVAGTLNGDFFAGGGSILVNGKVNGDVFVGGGTINILGDVSDDLRIGGGNILIQSNIGGDVMVGGGQIHIAAGKVGGDVIVGGGVLQIEAPVAGDVRFGGGEIYINAPVAGSVFMMGEKIKLGPKAIISGNLNYESPKEVEREAGSEVRGEVNYEQTKKRDRGFWAGVFSFGSLIEILCSLVFALLLGLFFNRYSRELVLNAYSRPLRNMLRGLLFVIVTPIIAVILMVTVIGIPLGILALLGYAIALLFSVFAAPLLLGSLIGYWYKREHGYRVTWKTIVAGVIAFFILGLIPIIGWAIQCLLILMTLGTCVRIKWNMAQSWR